MVDTPLVRPVKVLHPASLRPRSWLVRLWEIEDRLGAKPQEIEPFKVEARSRKLAEEKIHEVLRSRKRRIRSMNMTDDGRFVVVVFTGTRHTLARDFSDDFAAVRKAHKRRRERVAKSVKAARADRPDLTAQFEARVERAKELRADRRSDLESRKESLAQEQEARRQQDEARRQERLVEHKEVYEARREFFATRAERLEAKKKEEDARSRALQEQKRQEAEQRRRERSTAEA